MDSLLRTLFPFFVPALLTAAGCASEANIDGPELAKYRQQFTLADEPDGVQTVSEVRTELSGEAAPNVLALLEEEGDEAGHDHAEHADHDEHDEATGDDSADHAAEEHADHDQADHDAAEHDAAEHDDANHDDSVHDAAHAAGEHPESLDVALVGIVGGVPNPAEQAFADFPFAQGKAMFILADPEAVADLEEHGHQHAPGEECAFCAAHAADAQALIAAVTFADEDGKILPIDSRKLFDLKEKDAVVVKGTAKLEAGGILSVHATGIYVRR